MDTDDGTGTAQSLADRLDQLTFAELTESQATARILDTVADWAGAQGWRVYRRAPSVFPLPAPLRGNSVLDVACARPDGPPIAIEIDRSDRQRTVDKLLAEAAAGRVAIWVRWGAGPFPPPPLPVHLVTRETARRAGKWHTVADMPAPAHSEQLLSGNIAELPLEDT
ncbi:hypothetical protein FB565_003871 [Actinoplanes lutulentus]|uniref:Uncharacterized protein n=1 Tax=Actinoplanes lutulentus TaxID=1287878 RepID=A0A327ZK63_9ACTN|nr:hypothetical protein [Actinoplanes lutulentus]MBB2944142.1 hypothetical protein [Actinoplanes lutulentus]RAK42625.1 hypothetical protein B0I29_102450 [Actinoplanes lutulentus]